ncbi:apyrase 6 [Tripterygium wilfordii]|uniref:Apyrase 6 n=2 Tax=Tripterygium wilfordii TaxID=458696 RepID=A0A7J7DF22_TRIWF|nr:apyrase 6 [Tripterygium wilfordii]
MDFSNLQSRASNAYIPPHRTQIHPRMHIHLPSYPHNSANKSQHHHHLHRYVALFASILTIPFLFYLFSTARKIHQNPKFVEPNSRFFGVVIASGSTGSRVRVFEFLGEGQMPFIAGSISVRPSLSGFAEDAEGAGRSIAVLIEFAKQQVPRKEWGNTKVQLMVARGVMEGLGFGVRKGILESCRLVLKASGFAFKDAWARVVEGEDEGVYAWVAVNYGLGNLGGEPKKTTGIVEIGGTSLQIAFASRESTEVKSSRVIRFAGVTYNLNTQTLPHFGQDAAWESLHGQHSSIETILSSNSRKETHSYPCIPKAYELAANVSNKLLITSHPAGSFTACRYEVASLLKRRQDKCLSPPCKIVPSIFLEFQGNRFSPEKFLFVSEVFGLFPGASLFDLETAGQHYCEDDWETLRNQHLSIDDMDLSRYCFSSAYTVALLHDGLGIPMNDKRVGFANNNGSIPFDWTVGAFILSMLEPLELEPANMDQQMVGNASVTYFSVFAILLIGLLAAFFLLQLRKPQLKTIYDLEKGRYIVTRVPR